MLHDCAWRSNNDVYVSTNCGVVFGQPLFSMYSWRVLFDDSGTYQVVEIHACAKSNIACYCNGSATGNVDAEPNHETNFLCVGSLSLIRTVIIAVCDWIDTKSVTTMHVNGVGA